jgi:Poly (ADP-ribose) glycohydrolase (PARG)
MSAPPGGSGLYSEAEVHSILTTAFTGFLAARVDGATDGSAARTVVHTGHWGTGAFGGDKALMAILQILAARLAGVDRLVYHTFDSAGSEPYREAARFIERHVPAERSLPTRDVLREVLAMEFAWGVSDGN